MIIDEGDELITGDCEYTVLKKYNEDGKEYYFVADSRNPDINIADNFDKDALNLLLLSSQSDENSLNETKQNSKVEKDESIIRKILSFMFM